MKIHANNASGCNLIGTASLVIISELKIEFCRSLLFSGYNANYDDTR